MPKKMTTSDVAHIAGLAHIPVGPDEEGKLASGFTTTIAVIEKLNDVDVSQAATVHMTGLVNVTRDDEVDKSRMFSQDEALAGAAKTHNGFFVVSRVIDEE